eukprot:m.68990 g.68990  ORF g.68990 m.68990 type:complete len:237 (-) comp14102_c0_seq4:12-722(-)
MVRLRYGGSLSRMAMASLKHGIYPWLSNMLMLACYVKVDGALISVCCTRSFQARAGVHSVALSPSGDYLVAGLDACCLQVFRTNFKDKPDCLGKSVLTSKHHTNVVDSVAFFDDSHFVSKAAGDAFFSVYQIGLRKGRPLKVERLYDLPWQGVPEYFLKLFTMPTTDGWLLACGDASGRLHTYHLPKTLGPQAVQKCKHATHNVLSTMPTFVREVQITRDGLVIMACDRNLVVLSQ